MGKWLGKEISITTSEGQSYKGSVIRDVHRQYHGDRGSVAYFLQTSEGDKIFLPARKVKSDNEGNLVLKLNSPVMIH